ncbi:transposase, partial [Micromonospora sp. 4G55]|uniref:transposase n=1 Tax=Micromonospora sp. 4G55 TaxID=2806102 RepID=UPI0035C72470
MDAAKKIKGRKRHIPTDTLGLLLAVIVTAGVGAGLHRGPAPARHRCRRSPGRAKAWVDGGYNNAVRAHGARLGIDVEVVPRTAG